MKIALVSFILFSFALLPNVFAHCPLCAAATGSAVAVTRWYGLDDTIVGIFIGSLIVTSSLWFSNLLKKHKKEYIPYQAGIILLATFIITLITFYMTDLIGYLNPYKIFGIDKILVGIVLGSLITGVSIQFHQYIRHLNKNKNYLPYQFIVILLVMLSIGAAIIGFIV